MSNTAIAFGGQKHHLRFPAVRIERPTVAEHHRLSYTPILVINLRTIFHNDCAHNLPLFLSARVVGLSCPSYGSPPIVIPVSILVKTCCHFHISYSIVSSCPIKYNEILLPQDLVF